jgi:hypothetical protein
VRNRSSSLAIGGALVIVLTALAGCDSTGTLAPDLVPSPGAGCPPLTRDSELESIFPEQIDGQPVINVQSAAFLQTVCIEGGQSGVDALSSRAPEGSTSPPSISVPRRRSSTGRRCA